MEAGTIRKENPMYTKQQLIEIVDQEIEQVEKPLIPYHDAEHHRYTTKPDYPGVCSICGWLHTDSPIVIPDMKTLRQLAEEYLGMLQDMKRKIQGGSDEELKWVSDQIERDVQEKRLQRILNLH